MKTAWSWRGDQSKEVLEIRVPAGGLAMALIAKKALGGPSLFSKICVLTRQDLLIVKAPGAQTWLEEGLLKAGLKSPDVAELRLIGDATAIHEIGLLAKSLAFLSLGKAVPFSGESPPLQFLPREGRLRIRQSEAAKLEVLPEVTKARTGPVKVLIVDDSETIRLLLTRVISHDPQLVCVGAVGLPSEVEAAIAKLQPDVLTLDIHMPEMNGVELLKKLMLKKPIPAVMISSLSMEEGTLVLDALEAGAVDYIQKPSMKEISVVGPLICEKIKSASVAQIQAKRPQASVVRPKSNFQAANLDTNYLILIGSSTGGTEAVKQVLTSMPEKIPPILIVQHIPPVFSKAFADRMNQICPFEVKEAQDGDLVQANRVLIAPGGLQMTIRDRRGQLVTVVEDGDPVNRHKPSVDVLFHSAAMLKTRKIAAAILTGMGGDGARGLLALKNAGARTLAQNEATCVVYGMPKEAVKLGAAQQVVALDRISSVLLEYCSRDFKKAAI